MSSSRLNRTLLPALVMFFAGCAHGPPQSQLRKEASAACWKLRAATVDWRLAATQCTQELKKMDGVDTAWVDGAMVRVKFSDYTDEYGIWIK